MTQYASINTGPAGIRLGQLADALQASGISIDYLLQDIVETLYHRDSFNVEMLCLKVEIEHGDYYWHKLQEEPVNVAKDMLLELATLSEQIAKQMLDTINAQGIYEHTDQFPYEFKSSDCRVVLLQRRDLPGGGIRHE